MENGEVNGANGTNGAMGAKFHHWTPAEIGIMADLIKSGITGADAFLAAMQSRVGPHRTLTSIEYKLRRVNKQLKAPQSLLTALSTKRRMQYKRSSEQRKKKTETKMAGQWEKLAVAAKLVDRSTQWLRNQVKMKKVRRKRGPDEAFLYNLEDTYKLAPAVKQKPNRRPPKAKPVHVKPTPAPISKFIANNNLALAKRISWVLDGHYNVGEFTADDALSRIKSIVVG